MADMVASNDASAQLVTYSLGSCVGITVYDPEHKVGGMLQGREKARVVPSGWHFSDFQRKSAFPQQQPHSGILSRPTAWLS